MDTMKDPKATPSNCPSNSDSFLLTVINVKLFFYKY